jgi:hypothetical protein
MRVRSLPALEALQWFGLLAGPLAFAGEHVIGLGATFAQCSPAGSHWSIEPHLYQMTAMAVAALIVVLGELASLLAFLGTSEHEWEDDPPRGRIHFLATAGLAVGPVILTLVLLNGLGVIYHPDCVQA